jgi:hypothetical protein
MKSDLKKIKSAQGYLWGFYYTNDLRDCLESKTTANIDSKDLTNMKKALRVKPVEETFMQGFIIHPIAYAWRKMPDNVEAAYSWLKDGVVSLFKLLSEKFYTPNSKGSSGNGAMQLVVLVGQMKMVP